MKSLATSETIPTLMYASVSHVRKTRFSIRARIVRREYTCLATHTPNWIKYFWIISHFVIDAAEKLKISGRTHDFQVEQSKVFLSFFFANCWIRGKLSLWREQVKFRSSANKRATEKSKWKIETSASFARSFEITHIILSILRFISNEQNCQLTDFASAKDKRYARRNNG